MSEDKGTYLAVQPDAQMMEQVLIGGDLSKLSPQQRVNYVLAVCRSTGLNPLTKPFEFIMLNGKLTLYATKDGAAQLRKVHGVSIAKPEITYQDDWILVTVEAGDSAGRSDSDVGVVNRKDMRGDFGNAVMKAVTKAKRRVTLSICGLGILDETEVETIPGARPVLVNHETGEIVEERQAPATVARPAAPAAEDPDMLGKARGYFACEEGDGDPISEAQVQLLASKLTEAIGGGDVERHLFLEQVCGVNSTSELGKRQAGKMLDFLLDGHDLRPAAVQKVRALMRQARLAQGQQELM